MWAALSPGAFKSPYFYVLLTFGIATQPMQPGPGQDFHLLETCAIIAHQKSCASSHETCSTGLSLPMRLLGFVPTTA